jgi:hypothetical protein
MFLYLLLAKFAEMRTAKFRFLRRAAGCEATSRIVLCHKLRLFVLLHNIPLEVYCFAPLSKTHRLEQHRHIFVLNVFIWAKNLADCFHLQSMEKRELCNQDI